MINSLLNMVSLRDVRIPSSLGFSTETSLLAYGCLLEGLMLKLKLQFFGHLMQS